jgi:hypothetical protein
MSAGSRLRRRTGESKIGRLAGRFAGLFFATYAQSFFVASVRLAVLPAALGEVRFMSLATGRLARVFDNAADAGFPFPGADFATEAFFLVAMVTFTDRLAESRILRGTAVSCRGATDVSVLRPA